MHRDCIQQSFNRFLLFEAIMILESKREINILLFRLMRPSDWHVMFNLFATYLVPFISAITIAKWHFLSSRSNASARPPEKKNTMYCKRDEPNTIFFSYILQLFFFGIFIGQRKSFFFIIGKSRDLYRGVFWSGP